jgi:predicted transcriptional regulator
MRRENETSITIRFPSDLIEEIKQLAKIEARSINSEVVYAVQDYAARKRKELKERAEEYSPGNK